MWFKKKLTPAYLLNVFYPYLLITPAIIFVLVALLYPLLESFRISFYSYSLQYPIRFIGLGNYRRALNDPLFWRSFVVTCYFTVAVVVAELLLGLGLALLLNRDLKGRSLMRSLILAPLVLTPVVAGLMFRFMYNPDYGILDYFLSLVGLRFLWVSSSSTALLSVILIDIWEITPYPTILFLAGLQSIPLEQYEAAEMDGASRWQRFRHVTIPWLIPFVVLYLIVRTSDAFQIFDMIFALTGGGPAGVTRSLSIYSWLQGWTNLEFGYASAVSYVLVAFSAVFAIVYVRILRARVEV